MRRRRSRRWPAGRYLFSDQRESNREVRAVYYSFALFVYGFLAVIALIAVFNIVNSIGMSVSARMYQYGAMRAIGTSIRQLNGMIAAETFTYLACGLCTGLAAGLSAPLLFIPADHHCAVGRCMEPSGSRIRYHCHRDGALGSGCGRRPGTADPQDVSCGNDPYTVKGSSRSVSCMAE